MRRAEKFRAWKRSGHFPWVLVDSSVGEYSQSRASWPLEPVQEIRSRGNYSTSSPLLANLNQESIPGWDPLASSVSGATKATGRYVPPHILLLNVTLECIDKSDAISWFHVYASRCLANM